MHPGRDSQLAGNNEVWKKMYLHADKARRQRSMVRWDNKECGRNELTCCQGTQTKMHSQPGTTKNMQIMTYMLSRHPGRDSPSAGNNKEYGRNGLTSCQSTHAEIHGEVGTTKNVEKMDLPTVKAPKQKSTVSQEQQEMGRNGLTTCQGTR